MKRPLIALLFAAAAAATAPAAVADHGHSHYSPAAQDDRGGYGPHVSADARRYASPFAAEIASVRNRIHRAAQRGLISPREARTLARDAQRLSFLESSYRRDGVSPVEARDLELRIDRLRARLRSERRDFDPYAEQNLHNDPRPRPWS